jgi:type III pantothenate kinase
MTKNNLTLCLDVGNSQIFAGVFHNDTLQFTFRHDTTTTYTSDQLGIFLKSALRENCVEPEAVKAIAIASVVPPLDYSIDSACRKYFDIEPFILHSTTKTGLKIKYANPHEIGADLLAEAVAAMKFYPKKNVIIVDFGTATTICPISSQKEFLGGIIIPGIRLCMESLQNNTAKLPTVRIVKPKKILGNTTIESIQAGLYYGQLAAVRETTRLITKEHFANRAPIIIGTGGFAHMFSNENIFDIILPNIVLDGLFLALKMNI